MNDDADGLPDLPELPELEALVQGYRAETHRSADQVDAAFRSVSAQVGTATATKAGLSTTAKAGLLATLVGVVGVAGLALSQPEPPAQTAAAPAPAPTAGLVTPAAPAPEAELSPALPPSPPKAQPTPPPPDDIAPAVTPKPRRKTRPRPKPAPTKAAPKSTLAEELRQLQKIRATLRAGSPARARQLIDAHRRDFPDSTLAQERDATEVAALCAQGRNADAQRKARAFTKQYPGTHQDLLADCDD